MSDKTYAAENFNAAVVRQQGGPFAIESINALEPRPDEVLIEVVATGMCHTDMVARDQIFPVPQPVVLGHEGAGIVRQVGAAVTKVAPGDHVVMSFHSCGQCAMCQQGHPAYCEIFNDYNFSGGRPQDDSHALCDHNHAPLHDRFFGQSSFGAFAIANQANVVKVRKDAPLELLGPLGCGIQTGSGTVINALKVRPGSSFVAFGGGAVGLSAIMAAKVCGATTIIAVDIVPSRLELALELGATHVINSKTHNPVEEIKRITGKGADYAMDSTGIPAIIRDSVLALRPHGKAAIVGASKPGTNIELDVMDLMMNVKSVQGVIEGNSIPDIFIPQLIDLYMMGRFPFDKLVKFYSLEDINKAAEDSEKGLTIKPIVRIKA